MKLNKPFKGDKKLIKYIENKIRENKNAYMGKGTNVNLILKNKKKFMNSFSSRNKLLQKEYNKIKSENQSFSNIYKNFIELKDNQAFIEGLFKDNLSLYEKKGFTIPNLTTKNNIMKNSPLFLNGEKDINKFYLQDLYSLNKKFKKIWSYDKIQKLISEKNVTFDDIDDLIEKENDDNELEGINTKFFLKNYDLLVKQTLKEKKENRINKSLDINNWFKQDLFSDPFLTQGNNIYNDSLFDSNISEKSSILNKEIENLTKYNDKIKKRISQLENNSFDRIRKGTKIKRHSVFILNLNQDDNKDINQIKNNFQQRSHEKKMTLPHKKLMDTKLENFYKSITSKNSEKEEKNNSKYNNYNIFNYKTSLYSSKARLFKRNNFKSNKNNLIENNKITKRTYSNSNIKNIDNMDKYKKRFQIYSGKEPKALLTLMNASKYFFHKRNIVNIFSQKFKLSKINDLNSKYSFLENYLRKGLLSKNFN